MLNAINACKNLIWKDLAATNNQDINLQCVILKWKHCTTLSEIIKIIRNNLFILFS